VGKWLFDLLSDLLLIPLAKLAAAVAKFIGLMILKMAAKVDVFFELLGRDLYENLAKSIGRIVARSFAQNPRQIEATEKLTSQIGEQIVTSQNIISMTFWSCFVITALFLILPLLYKALFRRNLRIFISFSRLRSDVAEPVHAFLEKCGFRISRLPFDKQADHQTILQKVLEFIEQSDLVVCVPGPSDSFVEHEVFSASAIGHPVILVISEKNGTIPNTADKRYPAFKMETLVDKGFQPMATFISFIGGDLTSMRNICSQALRQGALRHLSLAMLLLVGLLIIVLWIMCFIAVLTAPAATFAIRAAPSEAYVAIGSYFVVLAFCASVTALCAVYCMRVLQSQIRQLLAQRRARLKVKSAEFRRDDWNDLKTDLSSGDVIYQAMFETAPQAHHERLVPEPL